MCRRTVEKNLKKTIANTGINRNKDDQYAEQRIYDKTRQEFN